MTVRTTTLDSGARVVTEVMPHARSVSAGLWVGVGARDEPAELAGASHFLEHLLFKGTAARSASEIAEAVEAVGGEINAFTTHEYTAYHTRLPAAELPLGLELLGDVFTRPAFRPHEVEAERRVIQEELLMEEDCHEERVLSVLAEALFPGHPLGAEVLGTRRTIEEMDRDDIAGFHSRWYRPANLVVAAAGPLDHDAVVDAVQRHLAGTGAGTTPVRGSPRVPPRALGVVTAASEQSHLAVGLRALSRHDDDRYALAVANQILGGGTASRLFRTIREDRGLAYSVYSYTSAYADTGALVAAAATAPSRLPDVLELVQGELDRLLREGVTDDELRVAKGYLEGSTLLALEDTGSCMSRIATALLVHGEVVDVGEVIERFRAVGPADVGRALQRVLGSGPPSVAVLGPLPRRRVESMVADIPPPTVAPPPSSAQPSGVGPDRPRSTGVRA